ncbi:M61 family metallopeptidase [Plebeiibacterium marinum]|uniref:Peptidase M61 n=1 Tax=Plebeiibacterium marinum TaxID=2992111 RepID=A0AAE3MHC2_9BACT|nr:hypothetical protein [Plebeiobacterium marinum]MCW3807978.1 hypothetical protein [Plebeiobacterium marinum]
MNHQRKIVMTRHMFKFSWVFLLLTILYSCQVGSDGLNRNQPKISFELSVTDPDSHGFMVDMSLPLWHKDQISLKLPDWMPGYYQIMDYSKDISALEVKDDDGNAFPVEMINKNTWLVKGVKNKTLKVNYKVSTSRQFVANNFIDQKHAYIVCCNTFLYVDGYTNLPVQLKINNYNKWNDIATGLEPIQNRSDEFTAPNFDILYDCPILMGNLEKLTSFFVNGIEHQFVGYELGDFNKELFMYKLKRVVESAVDIIGEIPYSRYTFIAIGPGMGGIEHLNNTIITFNGNELNSNSALNGVLSFLAHEYFHHYNVKRIRPVELGPFNYDKPNRTNMLWVSEGLTVYYQHMILRRAGITSAEDLLEQVESQINTLENDPGRLHQTLAQSSYYTWEDGPFGNPGGEDQSISVYNKGTVVAALLDLKIRTITQNKKTLDDVMQALYYQYYKDKGRGFTDAEFQSVCEDVAGTSLKELFEYVYSTKSIDYQKYYEAFGLAVGSYPGGSKTIKITKSKNPNASQLQLLNSWLDN